MEWFKLVWSIADILFYMIHLATNINAVSMYFSNGDFWWGCLSGLFTALPNMIPSVMCLITLIQNNDNRSLPLNCLLVLGAIFTAPVMLVGILIWHTVDIIKGENTDCHPAWALKLFYAMMGAYPQAGLQMYIAIQFMNVGAPMEIFQWLSIAGSLIALAFLVSTSNIFDEYNQASMSSRLTFLIYGLLAITSRLLVASVFSMINRLFWYVPICTELAASIIMWSLIRGRPCSKCVPLDWNHHNANVRSVFSVGLFWVMTAGYNAFTMTGLVISTINLGFVAVATLLLPSLPVIYTAITTAAVSWVTNVIIATVPVFKNIKNDWLQINHSGESHLY